MKENSFQIENKTISKNSPTYFIADIAANMMVISKEQKI